MTVVSGADWHGVFATRGADGSLLAPDVIPVGALWVNGVATGAVVTINGANPYSWDVTLPALADGDCVSMYITATIAGIATAGVVAEDTVSTVYISSRGTADPGDAMALTVAERTTVAGVVWTYVTRTLTSFGTLVAQIVNALGSKVVAIFPVANGGNVTTYQGDTYNNTIGRPIDWTATDWPDLTGATIRVYVGGLTFTGTVITPTGNQRVRLDLTATQTASIPTNVRRFQVVATLSGGGNATLVEARWDSRSRPTA